MCCKNYRLVGLFVSVAPLASRLPLLPIASHRAFAESRPLTSFKQIGASTTAGAAFSTADANFAGRAAPVDYTGSAAAALREMRQGLLNSNVAADLGSSVSNISSFLRGKYTSEYVYCV